MRNDLMTDKTCITFQARRIQIFTLTCAPLSLMSFMHAGPVDCGTYTVQGISIIREA